MADPSTTPSPAPDADAGVSFLESLMDTDLYSIGAYFCDQNPGLVDEVVARSAEIEAAGLGTWAGDEDMQVEEAFGVLLTGLAVRYYKAVTA